MRLVKVSSDILPDNQQVAIIDAGSEGTSIVSWPSKELLPARAIRSAGLTLLPPDLDRDVTKPLPLASACQSWKYLSITPASS